MQKRHIITINGMNGSGKSSTAKLVATTLGYPHHSGGDFMRAMAKERGISLAELGALAETDSVVDQDIDQSQKKFMDSNDSFVIDSRLGWFFAPDSFKVFLDLDHQIAATRVLEDLKKNALRQQSENTTIPDTVEKMMESLKTRLESERTRYKKYYGIENHHDHSHYDLVIDTGIHDLQTVSEMIIDGYQKWLTS